MDSKYGRLFTERDVLAIIDEALMAGREGFEGEGIEDSLRVLIDRAEADKAPMTFPPDEPLFLLRGKDKQAARGVEGYLSALDALAAHAPETLTERDNEHSNAVHAALCEIREWQQRNPDRLKMPD